MSKKHIPSAKTYTDDLSNITFNYLCENSPNTLCHFWNHESFFTTQFLYIFLAQTSHTFYKSSPSECRFSDFPLHALKFTKFLMSFFKQKVSFSSIFGPIFQCNERSFFSTFLAETLYAIDKSSMSKFKIFILAKAHIKIHQIPHVIFGTKSQFFLKLCITLQCHEAQLFRTFSSKPLYALDKKSSSKCKFLDFRLLTWKLTKYLMSFFKPRISFL